MDNKIKHYSATQSIPDMEFKPILRGESPYYGNLNRAPQSAYDYASILAEVQSWGGLVSILQPLNQLHEFKLYEIARIADGEVLVAATNTDATTSRYGIVVAEAEIDSITGLMKNIVVCTFCPNLIYPTSTSTPSYTVGSKLYLNLADSTFLSNSASGTFVRALARKTGTRSVFFSGTADIFGA